MITINQLRIYALFRGDIDGWLRTGTDPQKAVINESEWSLIEGFIQDIRLITQGLASETYAKLIDTKLRLSCDGKETIRELKKMASAIS